MVGLSKGTVAFVKATDYLKGVKRLKHSDIAENIGLIRWKYDQSRGGRREVSKKEIERLIENYPDIRSFFEEIVNELNELSEEYLTTTSDNTSKESELIKSLREIISAKNEIIKLKDEKIRNLEEDLSATYAAHVETLKKLYTEDEVEVEYKKRLQEWEELNKKG